MIDIVTLRGSKNVFLMFYVVYIPRVIVAPILYNNGQLDPC